MKIRRYGFKDVCIDRLCAFKYSEEFHTEQGSSFDMSF